MPLYDRQDGEKILLDIGCIDCGKKYLLEEYVVFRKKKNVKEIFG